MIKLIRLLFCILFFINNLFCQKSVQFVDSCFLIDFDDRVGKKAEFKDIYDFYSKKTENIVVRNSQIWIVSNDSIKQSGEEIKFKLGNSNYLKPNSYNGEMKCILIQGVHDILGKKLVSKEKGFVALRTTEKLLKDSSYILQLTFYVPFNMTESKTGKLLIFSNNKPSLVGSRFIGEMVNDTAKWNTSSLIFKVSRNQRWIILGVEYWEQYPNMPHSIIVSAPCVRFTRQSIRNNKKQ